MHLVCNATCFNKPLNTLACIYRGTEVAQAARAAQGIGQHLQLPSCMHQLLFLCCVAHTGFACFARIYNKCAYTYTWKRVVDICIELWVILGTAGSLYYVMIQKSFHRSQYNDLVQKCIHVNKHKVSLNNMRVYRYKTIYTCRPIIISCSGSFANFAEVMIIHRLPLISNNSNVNRDYTIENKRSACTFYAWLTPCRIINHVCIIL